MPLTRKGPALFDFPSLEPPQRASMGHHDSNLRSAQITNVSLSLDPRGNWRPLREHPLRLAQRGASEPGALAAQPGGTGTGHAGWRGHAFRVLGHLLLSRREVPGRE